MISRITITPAFNARKIINVTIGKDWRRFRTDAIKMGQKLTLYIQSYINSNRKRKGGIGNLAKNIKFYSMPGANRVSWGIGSIDLLNAQAKYWYVVNYGKMITGKPYVPYHGKFVSGRFGAGFGGLADSSFRGKGTQRFYRVNVTTGMRAGTPIRPMNYIQATNHQLDMQLKVLLARLRRGSGKGKGTFVSAWGTRVSFGRAGSASGGAK